MKKILLLLLAFFAVVGCDNVMNTPTKKVETFLSKYQTQDKAVMTQLDDTLTDDLTLNDTQKKDYKNIMKNQYQNLTYNIKDEKVNGDKAVVTVELEVYDYSKVMSKADEYLLSNQDEFFDDDDVVDNVKFMNYKIKQMQNAKEKVKYTLDFDLEKENGNWKLKDIDEKTRQKIHGIYNYS